MLSESKPKHVADVFGLEVLKGRMVEADSDFDISRSGTTWYGKVEGYTSLCIIKKHPEPIRRGEKFFVTGLTRDQNAVFLKPAPEEPDSETLCGTDYLVMHEARLDGLDSQVLEIRHDLNLLLEKLPRKN